MTVRVRGSGGRSAAVAAFALFAATVLGSTTDAKAQLCDALWEHLNTCTDLTPSATTVEVGESVTITATVTDRTTGAPVPGGGIIYVYTNLDNNVQSDPINASVNDGIASLSLSFSEPSAAGMSFAPTAFSGHIGYYFSDDRDPPVITVVDRATASAVGLSSPTITFGQSVAVTVTVTPSNSIAVGTAEIFVDGVSKGSAALSAGAATFTLSGLPAGTRTIKANYTGATGFADSLAGPVTLTVAKATSTASLALSRSAAKAGDDVTLTATVTGPSEPAGAVTFKDGTRTLGTAALSGGRAVFTATDLNAGAHSFRAFYAGTANVLPSTSTARSLTVAKRPSDTDLVAVRNPTTAGNAVVVATVEAKDVLPTGRVRVFEGSDARGTGLLGSARIKDLVVGQAHGCVLWSDGAVACWGRIGEKRLGARPLVMDDLGSEVDDIAGSAGGVCARSANGQIACIGRVGTARAALVRSDPDLSLTARGDRAACRVVDPEGDIVCSGDSGPGTPLAVKRASVRITLRGLNAGKNGLLAKYAGSANLLGSQSEKLVLTIQ